VDESTRLVQRGMPLLSRENTLRLKAARADTDVRIYDEVLYDVVERVERSGSIGKSDIGALLFWKRLQANTPWATRLHLVPDLEVRRVTAAAVMAVRDVNLETPEAARRGRSALERAQIGGVSRSSAWPI
jgi:hypothetical protein